ncbi:hypothetical protein L210DRAFT_3399785, partial [Boletus edulis BED1]
QAEYLKWAKENDFVSMLPKDCKQCKKSAAAGQWTQLDSHLQPINAKPKLAPYSDQLFHEAAIQWLVNTDQPILALEHPSFRHMIDVAARAMNGVKIPN